MSFPVLLYATWARPSTQTVIVCVVVLLCCVALGHRLRRHGLPILGAMLLLFAIPWGFALALFALDQVGLIDPYESGPIIQDDSDKVQMETPSIEHPRPTVQPSPTAGATAAAGA